MKKVISLVLCALLACGVFALTACGAKEYKAVEIKGVEVEEYGFAISKNAPNKEIVIAAMNKVITDLGQEKIVNHLTYHSMLETGEAGAVAGFEVVEPTKNTTNGTLVMYTEAGFPPYEYDTSNGIQGLDVDMMKLVANELEMAFEVLHVDFDALSAAITNLESGKTKVIAAGMTITAERQETFDFSDAYMSSVQYIVCAANKNFETLEDLKGKKIGVQLGTTGDFLIDDEMQPKDAQKPDSVDGIFYGTKTKLSRYKSAAVAFAALKAGKIDAVVIDEHPAKSLIANN